MIVGSMASDDVWDLAWGAAPQLQGVALWFSEVAATGWVMVVLMAIAFFFAAEYPRRLACLANTCVGKVSALECMEICRFLATSALCVLQLAAHLSLQVLNKFEYFYWTHQLLLATLIICLFHPFPGIPGTQPYWGYSDLWAWICMCMRASCPFIRY